jgi:hypothetical protein
VNVSSLSSGRTILVRSITKHFNSAFSRGVGYELMPPGLFFEQAVVRGYFTDFRAKTVSPEAESPSRLLPGDLAQLALGWWDRSLAGDCGAIERFHDICELLEKGAEIRENEWRWPYHIAAPKYKVGPPV